MSADRRRVYKICGAAAWADAAARSRFAGSADDIRDGFIHLSTGPQAAETARKYFSGQAGLVVAAFVAGDLGADLRWEPSRGGELFPHFYGALPTAAAAAVVPLGLLADGAPDIAAALKALDAANPPAGHEE
jgi:uncharacterized protein (DUF952 family)